MLFLENGVLHSMPPVPCVSISSTFLGRILPPFLLLDESEYSLLASGTLPVINNNLITRHKTQDTQSTISSCSHVHSCHYLLFKSGNSAKSPSYIVSQITKKQTLVQALKNSDAVPSFLFHLKFWLRFTLIARCIFIFTLKIYLV